MFRQPSARIARQERFSMTERHRGVQMLGWLSVIAGYGLVLALIRGLFVRSGRGFGVGRSEAFWVVFSYLLFFGFAVYLINVGRRAISRAQGLPRPEARFGWGRMLLGAILLFSSANQHFHLMNTPQVVKRFEPSNHTQAVTMNVTAIAIAAGCVLLIFSGIWRGLRLRKSNDSR